MQYLLQEPPLVVEDLQPTEQEASDARQHLNERLSLIRQSIQDIEYKAETIYDCKFSTTSEE